MKGLQHETEVRVRIRCQGLVDGEQCRRRSSGRGTRQEAIDALPELGWVVDQVTPDDSHLPEGQRRGPKGRARCPDCARAAGPRPARWVRPTVPQVTFSEPAS